MLKSLFVICSFFILLTGCAKKQPVYTIGIDPLFYPNHSSEEAKFLYPFSKEILKEIAQQTERSVQIIELNWDTLFCALNEEKVDAILHFALPKEELEKQYSFSHSLLQTGPVLVKKMDRDLTSLSRPMIGIASQKEELFLLQKTLNADFYYYPSLHEGCEALINDQIDGLFVPYLSALRLKNGVYKNTIDLVLPPFTELGLRMIALNTEQGDEFIKWYNNGLERLKKEKQYQALLEKWRLSVVKS